MSGFADEFPWDKEKRFSDPVGSWTKFGPTFGIAKTTAAWLTETRERAFDFDWVTYKMNRSGTWDIGAAVTFFQEASKYEGVFTPHRIAKIARRVSTGKLKAALAKRAMKYAAEHGCCMDTAIKRVVEEAETGGIEEIVAKVIADNPRAVADLKGGKKTAMKALLGQVMRATKGTADHQEVLKLLNELLVKDENQ